MQPWEQCDTRFAIRFGIASAHWGMDSSALFSCSSWDMCWCSRTGPILKSGTRPILMPSSRPTQISTSFEKYLELEDRLFEQVDEQVYDLAPAASENDINRFARGSRAGPEPLASPTGTAALRWRPPRRLPAS